MCCCLVSSRNWFVCGAWIRQKELLKILAPRRIHPSIHPNGNEQKVLLLNGVCGMKYHCALRLFVLSHRLAQSRFAKLMRVLLCTNR